MGVFDKDNLIKAVTVLLMGTSSEQLELTHDLSNELYRARSMEWEFKSNWGVVSRACCILGTSKKTRRLKNEFSRRKQKNRVYDLQDSWQ